MSGVDKIFAPLAGHPLIWHALDALARCQAVGPVALVLSPANLDQATDLIRAEGWSHVTVVPGGNRRQDSVRAGLDALPATGSTIVHDGARPLVSPSTFDTGLAEARHTGAAIAAVPVKDTIKVVDGDRTVTETPDRSTLWAVHTPQVFSTELLRRAHRHIAHDVTDDASMVELVGGRVRVFMDSYANIKVTTPEDLAIAEALMASRPHNSGTSGAST
jgi:2-C-methyl-D-erythritol 4-phosphate cytidylyltransferase